MTAETELLPLPSGNVAHLIATQAAEIEALRAEVERLNRILKRIVACDGDSTLVIRMGADAFAAAREYLLRSRDAAHAVQGEPVAYIRQEDFEFILADDKSEPYGTRQAPVFSRKDCRDPVPLYASPQPPAKGAAMIYAKETSHE